jgi:hypothetical protein
MKSQCKTCGRNCEGSYCFVHKPRKPFKAQKKHLAYKPKNYEAIYKDVVEVRNFFIGIWKKKPHVSEISGKSLGNEPLSIFFHHILPKEKYPEARLDEENIVLLTLEEHDNVEKDMYKYEEVNRLRDLLKLKYATTEERV